MRRQELLIEVKVELVCSGGRERAEVESREEG